jgi:uncharacterized membrane protein
MTRWFFALAPWLWWSGLALSVLGVILLITQHTIDVPVVLFLAGLALLYGSSALRPPCC